MNQFGKNLLLALCVVAALLLILGLKRKFAEHGDAALLSQPSAKSEAFTPRSTTGSPRPRVLQAKPVTHQEQAILSPTNSQFADAEPERSPVGGAPAATIATPIPGTPPRPLEAPDLVPRDEPAPSSAMSSDGENVPDATTLIETPTVPVAARPLPEFVLTDSEDSFWSISERVYGSAAYYRVLFRHNEANVLRPDQLRAGVVVKTPPLEVLRELYPTDFPPASALAP